MSFFHVLFKSNGNGERVQLNALDMRFIGTH